MKRMILVVLDSVGMGEMPDSHLYGDEGSNTLGNIALNTPGFQLPNLQRLGLSNIEGMIGYPPEKMPIGSFGRMMERSKGKDTTTGHWEMAGIILEKPFPVYPNGFPQEIVTAFERIIGTKILGNYAASGTQIIADLGLQHVQTGFPIVYTSADSVFQIAAHESVIPIDKLYWMCEEARMLLTGEHAVGRVIARPFSGNEGQYQRTTRRHDFSLKPTGPIVLEALIQNGFLVKAVGKIKDIFGGVGISESVHTTNNQEGIDQTLIYMKDCFEGLIFTNLVDFDMLYGHRNDIPGYAKALREFDARLPEILSSLKEEDILVITADHGCDPTTASTDHSREYVPLLVYGKSVQQGYNLKTRSTFSDISATIHEMFGLGTPANGCSFYQEILKT